jgi:hypothetical protein
MQHHMADEGSRAAHHMGWGSILEGSRLKSRRIIPNPQEKLRRLTHLAMPWEWKIDQKFKS